MAHNPTAEGFRRSARVLPAWEVQSAAYHRREASRCRALAADCLHQPTGDVLLAIAAEHDAKADILEIREKTLPG
jgi:hypothetical protein